MIYQTRYLKHYWHLCVSMSAAINVRRTLISENGGVPYRDDIITFQESSVPEGQSPYDPAAGPSQHLEIVDWSEAWREHFQLLAGRIQDALGWRALVIEHVGSTAVQGLP
ncbi:MAG: GrpB family protein, partial [Arthrobacter oryzae]